jgi:hypothetical protein
MKSLKIRTNVLLIFEDALAVFILSLVTAFLHYPLLLNAPLILQFSAGNGCFKRI